MSKDNERNQNQIIRKDARSCFVESLNDAFNIGKIHLAFATYDLSRPAGQRQTNNIHIYIAVGEFLELCRKLECGELRYLLQNKKKAIKRRFISASGVHRRKSLPNMAAPDRTGKACPGRRSYWQEANPISCLWPTAARGKPMPRG